MRPILAGTIVAALSLAQTARAAPGATDLREQPCPAGLDAAATCYGGRDASGAWLVAAVPKAWNQVLVVHAHGGPRLGIPQADDPHEDLLRFKAMVGAGYAWIGSTYRRGGYGVRMAAADVDASRAVFWQRFGKPRLTLLHGQSYGGNVAAKAAELYATGPEGDARFDGVLITNGVLFGGTRAYGFRADLRAVYQYYCRNLPRPDEPQYPLWQGLPEGTRLTRKDLDRRLDECTGADQEPARRSPEQARRLADISSVTGIAPENLGQHLAWATFTFQDLVLRRLAARNPFDNSRTVYKGSRDDAALNRGVARFTANPAAVDALAYDSDLTGLIARPTVTVHYKDDPVVAASADAAYAAQVAAAGKSHLLLRFLADRGTHSRLAPTDYLAPLNALRAWAETGARPAEADVRETCRRESGADHCSLLETH